MATWFYYIYAYKENKEGNQKQLMNQTMAFKTHSISE